MNFKRKTLLSAFFLLTYVFTLLAPVGLIPSEITISPALAVGGIDTIVGDDGSILINNQDGLKTGVQKTKSLVNMWSVFAILIVTAALIFAFVKVSLAGGQGQTRADALKSVGWALVAAAGIGSISLLIGVAYNTFTK